MYCTLYCVVFCPKTSLINLSSIARFLGCLPVQKWGMGQILDPRRRSRSLHHLSSSSPRSYKASTWSASSVNSQNGGHHHHHHSRWSPASSLNGGLAFTTSSTSYPTTTQHRCTFRFFDSTHPNPAVKFFFPENPSTLKLCAGSIPLGQWRNWLPAYLPYSCQVCHDSQSSKWGWTILTSAFFTWFWQNILGFVIIITTNVIFAVLLPTKQSCKKWFK